jgi:hypothetical protein
MDEKCRGQRPIPGKLWGASNGKAGPSRTAKNTISADIHIGPAYVSLFQGTENCLQALPGTSPKKPIGERQII